jgi:glycosyltransferase involved in cell wall biosynthesis
LNKENRITKNKLDILHVSPFYPPAHGGISNLVYNLCNSLKIYNNISIITSSRITDSNHTDTVSNRVFNVKSVYFPGWPYTTLKNFSIPLDLGLRINTIIKKGNFDIVHAHGHHYPICWIALNLAHKRNIPTVLSLHGTYALNPKKMGGKSRLENLFNNYIFRTLLSKCTMIIGGTKKITDYARRYSSTNVNFKIVPNGVNTSQFSLNLNKKDQYRIKYNLHHDKISILFVGRFDESKGALEFAKGAKLLLEQFNDKFEVIMVGDGALLVEIKQILNGINNHRIIKWLPEEVIHEVYIASDIFVLSSKFEGLPLVIIEAMNANLNILYSDVGGVSDILESYSKKRILDKVTPEEIFTKVLELSKNPKIRLFDQPSNSYAQTFDWSFIARDMNTIYNELEIRK